MSAKVGDLKTFQEQLDLQQEKFINWGIFLLMERLKLVCYLNLFKKVWNINQKSQISVKFFQQALQICNEHLDLDETECILASLIGQAGWRLTYLIKQQASTEQAAGMAQG